MATCAQGWVDGEVKVNDRMAVYRLTREAEGRGEVEAGFAEWSTALVTADTVGRRMALVMVVAGRG